jgi:hypothetical protein
MLSIILWAVKSSSGISATCGTTLYWHVSTLPDLVGIAGGCCAETGLPDPTYSVNHQKKAHWLNLPAAWDVFPH